MRGTHDAVVVLDELERADDVKDGHDARRLFGCARLRRAEEVVERRAGRLCLDDAAVVELPVEVRLVRDGIAFARLCPLGSVAVRRQGGGEVNSATSTSLLRRQQGTHTRPTYPTASAPSTGAFHRHAVAAALPVLEPATRRANEGLSSAPGLGASGCGGCGGLEGPASAIAARQ